jgi:hypothetical protein
MGPWKDVKTQPSLNMVVQKLIQITTQVVDQFTPNTWPTPYSKRWFTPDLKVQQVEVNQLRWKWQISCAELR